MRIALDQDPANPCNAAQTGRAMRQLRLCWTSLPKGSPDDNPVETLFGDIQQAILDNSNDPDGRTTQRRIGNHLRARNRRMDRVIRTSHPGLSPNLRDFSLAATIAPSPHPGVDSPLPRGVAGGEVVDLDRPPPGGFQVVRPRGAGRAAQTPGREILRISVLHYKWPCITMHIA
ncbi:MAG: superfamily endonuclease [Gemmataceae bacterium]|nr:superfamily endonuclease [Gemmataceae bacterium]